MRSETHFQHWLRHRDTVRKGLGRRPQSVKSSGSEDSREVSLELKISEIISGEFYTTAPHTPFVMGH